MPALPLRLSLEPLCPTRTPDAHGLFEYGFTLVSDGLALRHGDPLLRAYGAAILVLNVNDLDEETLQSEAFDPGRRLTLEADFDENDAPVLAVWDADCVRRGGTLDNDDPETAPALAGHDHGLTQTALVLRERRAGAGDRRIMIAVLVYAPKLVKIKLPADLTVQRPTRSARPRVVMLADRGDVRFWDPAGRSGPVDPHELPLSPELATALETLRSEYGELDGLDTPEREWTRNEIDQRAYALWQAARLELGRRFAVGFLGPSMRRPIWSPTEFAGTTGDDYGLGDDIPF